MQMFFFLPMKLLTLINFSLNLVLILLKKLQTFFFQWHKNLDTKKVLQKSMYKVLVWGKKPQEIKQLWMEVKPII